MAETTGINWCDSTFNPWIGCTKVGPGCDHCYAERDFDLRRHVVQWGPGNPRKRTTPANWKKPLQWNAKRFMECGECGWRGECEAELIGCGACGSISHMNDTRRRVFCASLADVFDNEVDMKWRIDLLELIAQTPNLDWLLLTKRIGNVERMLDEALDVISHGLTRWRDVPWPNVWLGASIVNQAEADRDIPKLLAVPARVRFLSMEPLLGPVDVFSTMTGELLHTSGNDYEPGWLDWIIAGGESGPHARPMNPVWVRGLRDQCAAAGVPFLFKQWGEWAPAGEYEPFPGDRLMQSACVFVDVDRHGHQSEGPAVIRFGTKAAGRLLDGVEHNGFPEVSA